MLCSKGNNTTLHSIKKLKREKKRFRKEVFVCRWGLWKEGTWCGRNRGRESNRAEELGCSAAGRPHKGERLEFQFCPTTLKKHRAKRTKEILKVEGTGDLSKCIPC